MSTPHHPSSLHETDNFPLRNDPEDYYRSSHSHLNMTDDAVSPISPADSQAPMMKPAQETPQIPSTHTFAPPPPTVRDYAVDEEKHPISTQEEFAPPQMPGVINYRTSMGIVNGEVGAMPNYDHDTKSSGLVPPTPMTPGLKSPATFKKEEELQKQEEAVQKMNKSDLSLKLKVRLAKIVLRFVNTACSLVVLALVASTFAIFNATKNLPPRNNLPPWAQNTKQWPQITVLVISSISLLLCLGVMFAYWRGGHKRAEKAALRFTIFGIATFIFAIVMWLVAAGVMQGSRNSGGGKDLWGWSCKDNNRRKLFENDINFQLVCRQQDWVLVCAIIEIVVEVITIGIYMFAFWRLSSKYRLRKSMDVRDKTRSELWMTKLQEQQEAEGGGGPIDETTANTAYNQLNSNSANPQSDAEEGKAGPAPFTLMPAPKGNNTSRAIPNINVTPPGSGHANGTPLPTPGLYRGPGSPGFPPPLQTPRSVSFQVAPGSPGFPPLSTPRSVSFQQNTTPPPPVPTAR